MRSLNNEIKKVCNIWWQKFKDYHIIAKIFTIGSLLLFVPLFLFCAVGVHIGYMLSYYWQGNLNLIGLIFLLIGFLIFSFMIIGIVLYCFGVWTLALNEFQERLKS